MVTVASASVSHATDADALLASWFSAQTNIQTWSADFTQTRTLKSLANPLVSTGYVVFATPNRFRWELGQPPQTIAVRGSNEMMVLYPPMKRAERYPLTGNLPKQWRDTLALLDAGFPRSQQEMEEQFEIIAALAINDTCKIIMQPKSAGARKFIPRVDIAFNIKDLSLQTTELQFADGSTLQNEFTNAVLNAKIDQATFAPELDADYKIAEPLKK